MNDSVLFMTGVSVFGLMLVAIVLTVIEFRDLKGRQQKRKSATARPGEEKG